MATSGVITSTMTAREVITRGMRQAKIIASGESPDAGELADGVAILNLMLKSWQADGCNLWREEEHSVSATLIETTLDPLVLDVMEARVETSASNERPLARWEWGQYVGIPNKTTTGTPCAFVVRKDRDETKMLLWPVPSEAMTINYTAARVIEDVATPDDNLDVPQAWLECVCTNMTVRLAEEFGATLPDTVPGRAAALYEAMRNMDRPASVFFQPG